MPSILLKADQKPLETIINHSTVEVSARLQRFIICCLPYYFTTKYIKGKTNVLTDCMSHLSSDLHITCTDFPHIIIKSITQHGRASDLQLERIHDTTSKNDTLSHVIHTVWPTKLQDIDHELKQYRNFHEQMTIEHGLIL